MALKHTQSRVVLSLGTLKMGTLKMGLSCDTGVSHSLPTLPASVLRCYGVQGWLEIQEMGQIILFVFFLFNMGE